MGNKESTGSPEAATYSHTNGIHYARAKFNRHSRATSDMGPYAGDFHAEKNDGKSRAHSKARSEILVNSEIDRDSGSKEIDNSKSAHSNDIKSKSHQLNGVQLSETAVHRPFHDTRSVTSKKLKVISKNAQNGYAPPPVPQFIPAPVMMRPPMPVRPPPLPVVYGAHIPFMRPTVCVPYPCQPAIMPSAAMCGSYAMVPYAQHHPSVPKIPPYMLAIEGPKVPAQLRQQQQQHGGILSTVQRGQVNITEIVEINNSPDMQSLFLIKDRLTQQKATIPPAYETSESTQTDSSPSAPRYLKVSKIQQPISISNNIAINKQRDNVIESVPLLFVSQSAKDIMTKNAAVLAQAEQVESSKPVSYIINDEDWSDKDSASNVVPFMNNQKQFKVVSSHNMTRKVELDSTEQQRLQTTAEPERYVRHGINKQEDNVRRIIENGVHSQNFGFKREEVSCAGHESRPTNSLSEQQFGGGSFCAFNTEETLSNFQNEFSSASDQRKENFIESIRRPYLPNSRFKTTSKSVPSFDSMKAWQDISAVHYDRYLNNKFSDPSNSSGTYRKAMDEKIMVHLTSIPPTQKFSLMTHNFQGTPSYELTKKSHPETTDSTATSKGKPSSCFTPGPEVPSVPAKMESTPYRNSQDEVLYKKYETSRNPTWTYSYEDKVPHQVDTFMCAESEKMKFRQYANTPPVKIMPTGNKSEMHSFDWFKKLEDQFESSLAQIDSGIQRFRDQTLSRQNNKAAASEHSQQNRPQLNSSRNINSVKPYLYVLRKMDDSAIIPISIDSVMNPHNIHHELHSQNVFHLPTRTYFTPQDNRLILGQCDNDYDDYRSYFPNEPIYIPKPDYNINYGSYYKSNKPVWLPCNNSHNDSRQRNSNQIKKNLEPLDEDTINNFNAVRHYHNENHQNGYSQYRNSAPSESMAMCQHSSEVSGDLQYRPSDGTSQDQTAVSFTHPTGMLTSTLPYIQETHIDRQEYVHPLIGTNLEASSNTFNRTAGYKSYTNESSNEPFSPMDEYNHSKEPRKEPETGRFVHNHGKCMAFNEMRAGQLGNMQTRQMCSIDNFGGCYRSTMYR